LEKVLAAGALKASRGENGEDDFEILPA